MGLLFLVVFASTVINATSGNNLTSKTEKLHINTIVNAEVIERASPKYPTIAAKKGYEGWVVLSYVIDPDGSTSNIIIEDSSNDIFEKEALRSIKKWRFSPATQDGEAIQQCRNRVQLDFKLAKPYAMSKKFKRMYQEATAYLNEEKIVQAESILEKMKENGRKNGQEDLSYFLLSTQIASHKGNKTKELQSINSTLMRHGAHIKKEAFGNLSLRAFQLAIELKDFGEAKSIYLQLEKKYPEQNALATLKPYYDDVVNYLNSNSPIIVDGKIGSREFWQYKLSRDAFVIDEVKGQLTNLEVRCENKLSQFLVEAGSEWKIPQSWGQCSVYIFGSPDASFTFAEVNASKTQV